MSLDGRRLRRGKTMFFPPKHKKLADIVSLKSPTRASESCQILLYEFERAETRAKKRRVKQATVLASNRAYAMTRKGGLSKKEQKDFATIGQMYKNCADKMVLD